MLAASTRFVELDAAAWTTDTVRVMARNISPSATFDLSPATPSVAVTKRRVPWIYGQSAASEPHIIPACDPGELVKDNGAGSAMRASRFPVQDNDEPVQDDDELSQE